MKHTLASLLLVILFTSGCTLPKPNLAPNGAELVTTSNVSNTYIKLVTFDGCDYVYWDWGHATWGSHSGTCRNPIHTQQIIHDTIYLPNDKKN